MEKLRSISKTFTNLTLMDGLILSQILLEDIGEIAQIAQLLEISIDGIQLLDFLPFELEGLINLQGQVRDLVHRGLEHLKFVIDHADVVFHLADGVNRGDELAIILEDEGLDFVVVHLDFFVNFVVLADQLFDGVLFQHGQHIALGVKVA